MISTTAKTNAKTLNQEAEDLDLNIEENELNISGSV